MMNLRGGIVGNDKIVRFYCELPVYVKSNDAINWPVGVYLDKSHAPYDLVIVVANKSPCSPIGRGA